MLEGFEPGASGALRASSSLEPVRARQETMAEKIWLAAGQKKTRDSRRIQIKIAAIETSQAFSGVAQLRNSRVRLCDFCKREKRPMKALGFAVVSSPRISAII